MISTPESLESWWQRRVNLTEKETVNMCNYCQIAQSEHRHFSVY